MERDSPRLMGIIKSKPSEATQVLANLAGERIDYFQGCYFGEAATAGR